MSIIVRRTTDCDISRAAILENEAIKKLQAVFYPKRPAKFLGWKFAEELLNNDGTITVVSPARWQLWKTPFTNTTPAFGLTKDQIHQEQRKQFERERNWNPVWDHLKGLNRGIAALSASHVPFISVDLDNHEGANGVFAFTLTEQLRRVLYASRVIERTLPSYSILCEINTKNGSTKFFCFNRGRPIPIEQAKATAAAIAAVIEPKLGKTEVFPCIHTSQVGLPCRRDKITIGSHGVVKKIRRRGKTPDTGRVGNFECYSAIELHSEIQYGKGIDLQAILDVFKTIRLVGAAKQAVVAVTGVSADGGNMPSSTTTDIPRPASQRRPDGPNAFDRQFKAILKLCRQQKRIVTVEEALEHIRLNNLFTAPWRNPARAQRVASILKHISRTFDASKCGKTFEVDVGKYDKWARANYVCPAGEAKTDWRHASAFLSITEFAKYDDANEDGTLPQERAEELWTSLHEAGEINVRWCSKRWRSVRRFFTRRGILRVSAEWRFGHGSGKAKVWTVQKDIRRLVLWYRNEKKSTGNPPSPLSSLENNSTHHHPLNTYREMIAEEHTCGEDSPYRPVIPDALRRLE